MREIKKEVVYDLGFDKDIVVDDVYEIEINFTKNNIVNREPISCILLYKTKKFTDLYEYNEPKPYQALSYLESNSIARLYADSAKSM